MNRVNNYSKLIVVAIILVATIACQKNDLLSPDEQQTSLKINLHGLQTPAPNARYVLWAVYDSAKIDLYAQIDSFKINNDGQLLDMDYNLNLGVLQKMHTLLVTMETEDSLTQPGLYSILAAKIKANQAAFSIGDDYILKFDVSAATDTFQVVKAENSDKIVGIWFVKGDSIYEPGIELPEAVGLWKYTSYIVKDGKRYDMGAFTSPDKPDDSNIYGEASFPYPGENFLKDPETGEDLDIDLRGAEVYVEIIPPAIRYDADGDGEKESYPPFQLIMFKGQIPQDAQPGVEYALENNSATFPGGSVEININLFK
ncbi:hypothetical protein ACX8XN_06895 [Calditrichota bacterium GD2]